MEENEDLGFCQPLIALLEAFAVSMPCVISFHLDPALHHLLKKKGVTYFSLNDDPEGDKRECLDLIARGCRVVYQES